MMKKLKIAFATSPVYDYMPAGLTEGLLALGHEVVTPEVANYGKAVSNRDFVKYARTADLVLVSANSRAKYYLVRDLGHERIVYVDGSDQSRLSLPPNVPVKLVFKREILKVDGVEPQPFVFPLPFAAEMRFFVGQEQRDIKVLFGASLGSNLLRYSVAARLAARKDPAIFAGSTGENASAPGATKALSTPRYQDMMGRAQIGVNVAGAGWDCVRYWEILAAGAMLFSQKLDIYVPHPFEDGANCVEFGSLDEFDVKLDELLAQPDRVREIALAGHQHLLDYHTTEKRAAYFIELALEHIERSGCFYREVQQPLGKQLRDTVRRYLG